jgi:hypothetical protein
MTRVVFITSLGLLTIGILYRVIPVDTTFTANWTPDREAAFYQVQVLAGNRPIAEYVRVSDSLTATVTASRENELQGRMRTCYRSKCTEWTEPVLLRD